MIFVSLRTQGAGPPQALLPSGALPASLQETPRAPAALSPPASLRPVPFTQTPASLAAPPTNYGLYEHLKQRWLTPRAAPRESIYTSSYLRPPLCAMSRREHAIPVPPPRLHPVPRF